MEQKIMDVLKYIFLHFNTNTKIENENKNQKSKIKCGYSKIQFLHWIP